MSRSHPIYNKITREPMSNVQFGARDSFDQTVLVGTSATNSHEFARVRVERHVATHGAVTFSLWIDDELVRRAHLCGSELHTYDIGSDESTYCDANHKRSA